ncbi:MAG: efflux RND transporter periplasmic adaptor subunit [Deltaproteobacteria bacterium]|nr:efflux RND transporter periplasmic adaptor subunit [Deltaproteobacteria bacterium]
MSEQYYNRRFLLRVLFAITLFVIFTGCDSPITPTSALRPPIDVTVQKVTKDNYQAFENLVGTLRSGVRASIEPKIAGRISGIFIAPGQLIGQGQVIAELDLREIKAKLDQAVAIREQAEKELRRYTLLLEQKAASQQEYDTAEGRYRVAKAAANEAEAMLAYTNIVAPFNGIVTRKFLDIGDQALPGKSIIEMEDPSAMQVETSIPEDIINNVTVGQLIEVTFANSKLPSTMIELSPSADPNSRTFPAKLQLKNETSLKSGQLVTVKIPLKRRLSIFAPLSSIIKRGQLEFAYIAKGDTASMRIVRTGRVVDSQIEILSGLDADELVIVKGHENIISGQNIKY